ncbi:hypothetical protein [Microvirga sp. BSC39]|uniref:hypothetical protein n=1 Tax=Microvirga sp. BSC39 TaxID=1549810 RepID=UPI0004E8B1C1|nr:hypothetical protein [Microvirga sp. BSC39]KFG67660.1 hypothetical protein JH26_21415 [Microvirga sp. BSC39]
MTKSDIPPTHTINPIDQPPDSDSPTAAMLKADIDSGASGDKTEVFDPGMAMLGTCEEASGTPLTPAQLAWARRQETFHRWRNGVKTGIAHHRRDGFPAIYVGFIVLAGLILVSGISMARI